MTIYLKQSTASQEVPLGFFVDSTDGNTEETALTLNNTDIWIWKNGATTLANKNSGGGTHIQNGVYYCTLDATDTGTLGPLVIYVHKAGALPVKLECVVLAANVFDSLIGGGDVLDVSATQFAGQTITCAAGVTVLASVGTASTSTAQTGDAYARLGAPAGASVSADVAAIKADSGAIKTKTDYLPSATAGAAGGVFIAGTNAATSITTALTANITGNLSGSVGSVTGAVGSVTGNVGGNVTGSVGSVTGAVGSVTGNVGGNVVGSVASVTNNVNAVLANTAHGGAAATMQLGGAGGLTSNITGNLSGSVGSVTGAVGSVTGAVGSVTGNVGGNVVGSVASVTGNVGGNVVGSVASVTGNVGGTVATVTNLTNAPTNGDLTATMKTSIETAVQNQLNTAIGVSPTAGSINERVKTMDDAYTATRAGYLDNLNTGVALTAAGIDAIWDEATSGHTGAGTTGKALTDANNGTPPTAAAIADAIWDEAQSEHTTAGSTGNALNAAGSAGDPWSTPLPGAYGAGTAGKIIGDNINATISSRSSHSAADVWTNGTRTLTSFGTLVADIWANATRTLTAISDSSGVTTLLSRIVGTLASGTHNAQSGDAYALIGTAGAGLTALGDTRLANLDSTVSSRLASASYTAPLDAAGTRTAVGMATANLDTQLSAINAKTTNLPANPASQTNLDVAVSTRLASASYTAPDNATISAINTKTTNLPASPAATSDIPSANANADALLDRANGVESGFTLRQALRLMLSALAGKLSGAATTSVTIRDVNDTKARITATVDADGNRSAVTTDVS